MAYTINIQRDSRRIVTTWSGVMTDADMSEYQREVWALDDIYGYDELVDFRNVEGQEVTSSGIRSMAAAAADKDDIRGPGSLVMVAAEDLGFGFSRMYENYRETERRSVRTVEVFNTMEDALTWLESKSESVS